jgi:cytochrome c2
MKTLLPLFFGLLSTTALWAGEAAPPPPTVPPVPPPAPHVPNADHGKILFATKLCSACHSVTKASMTSGPTLLGVVGRKAATVKDFANYSAALKKSGLVWTEPALDEFLAAPMKKLPGTTMPIAVPAADDRADVIAYLKSLAPKAK